MGQEGRYALVAMTNGNVYNITQDIAAELKQLIATHGQQPLTFFETVDAKMGSRIVLSIGQISSIVIPKGGSRG